MKLHDFDFLNHASSYLRDSVFCLSIAITVVVFILLIISLVTFRKSKSSLGVEMVWAIIPFVMLFVMLVPIINMVFYGFL